MRSKGRGNGGVAVMKPFRQGRTGLCGAGPRPAAASQAAHLPVWIRKHSGLPTAMPAQRRPERPPQAEGLPHLGSRTEYESG